MVEQSASSPASSGPAGPLFEGQVGAYYLLALLSDAPPRGLLGTTVERIELQRASEGHPLDDIIVHARDSQAHPAVLAIQVKRTVTLEDIEPEAAKDSRQMPHLLGKRYLFLAIAL